MSIENVNSLEPFFLGYPMLHNLTIILVEVGIKEKQIYSTVTEDELIDDLGFQIEL